MAKKQRPWFPIFRCSPRSIHFRKSASKIFQDLPSPGFVTHCDQVFPLVQLRWGPCLEVLAVSSLGLLLWMVQLRFHCKIYLVVVLVDDPIEFNTQFRLGQTSKLHAFLVGYGEDLSEPATSDWSIDALPRGKSASWLDSRLCFSALFESVGGTKVSSFRWGRSFHLPSGKRRMQRWLSVKIVLWLQFR